MRKVYTDFEKEIYGFWKKQRRKKKSKKYEMKELKLQILRQKMQRAGDMLGERKKGVFEI